MKIFISWSGERSRYIAENLSNWLEQVLQSVDPWISTDIDKGRTWNKEIASKLSESKVAIICLTKDNLDSKWIHFEAGAIAKTEDAQVCTFLFDITPANVEQPLSQFQSTKYEKGDLLKLLKTINTRIGDTGGKALKEQNLESVFTTFWPQLKEKLDGTPKSVKEGKEIRTDRELLEESLELLRNIKISSEPLSSSNKNKMIIEDEINIPTEKIIDRMIQSFCMWKEIRDLNILKNEPDDLVSYILDHWPIKVLSNIQKKIIKQLVLQRISEL